MKIHRHKALTASSGRSEGFSLLELLVVLAIASVLSMVMVPSMSNVLRAQRCVSLVNEFMTSLYAARSEAIKRNGRTVVCKSADGLACTNTGGWDQGWIMFHDKNNNAARDADEVVLQQHAAVSDLRLRGNLQVAGYVSYSATGTAKLSSGAFQSGTFTLCPPSDWDVGVRRIVLSPTGRLRTAAGAASDCP